MSLLDNRSFGIDLSAWQTNVDYTKAVADGVTFAIIRAGYGRNINQKDKMFDAHFDGFKHLGIPCGAYQYSYASSVDGAVAEAEACIEWLKGKDLRLPVFYDLEDSSVAAAGKETITQMALAWCSMLNMAGFSAGVYANKYWYDTFIDAKTIANAGYAVWCASWGTIQPDLPGLAIWQFGGETNKIRSNQIAGIGICDQNYLIDESILTGKAEENPEQSGAIPQTKGITTLELPVLKPGASGYFVALLQFVLKMKGFNPGNIDGDFGKNTQTALNRFKATKALTADGVCDAVTWGQLI